MYRSTGSTARCSRWRLAAALAVLAAASAAALTVDTGHQGAITALAVDSGRGLLASAGSDGTVRVWDLKTGRQEAALAVSRSPVQRLAIHPSAPLLATVDAPTTRSARITVWDWSRGSRLYSVDLPDMPLHLSFSTLGTYLVYTRADYRSISILDARSGRALPYLSQGFGIVSFVAFSRTERNLMAYQPSGKISYWELRSGDKIKEVATVADLAPRRITEDLATMLARSRTGLAVIDVATGEMLADRPIADVLALDASPDGSRILVVSGSSSGRSSLSQWSYWGGSTAPLELAGAPDLARMTGGLTALAAALDAVYVGDERGTIVKVPFYGAPAEISRDNLARLNAVAAGGDRTALADAEGVWLFEIDTTPRLFGGRSTVKGYRAQRIPLPGMDEPAVSFLDDRTLAVWDRSGRALRLYTLAPPGEDLALDEVAAVPDDLFGSPLLGVASGGPDALLTLEADGTIQLIDRSSFARLYRLTAQSTRAVIWMPDGVLVGARTRLSRLEHPLIRINTRTGETVPLPDTAFLSYALAADPARARFFSLAVEESGGESSTTVRLHDGAGFERLQTVIRYAGEDGGASIAFDADGARLYSSIGMEGVQEWADGRVRPLEASTHVPRALAAGRRLLAAINRDRTVSLWETRSGRLLADLYVFADSSWLAVLPQENRVYSRDADRYILER